MGLVGSDPTDNLHSFIHSGEAFQDHDQEIDEVDEDEDIELIEVNGQHDSEVDEEHDSEVDEDKDSMSIEQLKEELAQSKAQLKELFQTALQLYDERFSLFIKQADDVLDKEREQFVYQKTAESFQTQTQSDIYMLPEESTLQFLTRLSLEFQEQKLRDSTAMDNFDPKYFDLMASNVVTRIGTFLTDQERISLHIDVEKNN